MTYRALFFPAPEKRLRGAPRNDRAEGPVRASASGPAAIACGTWVASVTTLPVASGRAGTRRCPRSRSARLVARTLRHGIHARWTPLLCLAIVLVDQATKALQPGGTFVVNTGGIALLPAPLESMLWKSQ